MKVVRPDYVVMATSPPDCKQNWMGWAFRLPRKQTVDLLVRYVRKTREAVNVPVATAVKKFSDFRLTKAIYANGWDGNVVMEANIAGVWKVYGQRCPTAQR